MSFSKAFLLFLSFLASASALATPHVPRGVHHRALAGRIPVPASLDVPAAPIRRRQNSKRCRPRPSSVSAQPANVTSSRAPETTRAAPSTSQAPPPPAPTTTKAVPTTTHKPSPTPDPSPSTTKQQPPPATTHKPDSNLPSFMVGTQTGEGTWYNTGLGACGITNSDSDKIAAVSHLLFDAFPGYKGGNSNLNPICGRKITATYKDKSVTVAITDRCVGCAITDLDFSPAAFNELANPDDGRLPDVKWTWN